MRGLAAAIGLALATASSALADDMRLIGDLRQIGQGALVGTIALKDLTAMPDIYGLGMINGLQGELLVLDGKAYLGQTGRVLSATDLGASSMVAFGAFATVPHWDSIPLPDEVRSFKDLAAFIATSLSDRKFDPAKPTPFRLTAKAIGLRWFVVGGMGNLQPSPRDSFYRQIVRGGLDDVVLEAYGFHSTAHRGIYTNPVSDIHMHFRTTDGTFVAHLDDEIVLQPGGQLLVPAAK
jgi:acetolactate decarboxylase